MLTAAYDRVQDEAAAAVVRTLGTLSPADPARAMAVVLSAYLDSITSDPYRAKLAFIEVVGASDRMEQHRRERRHGWVTLLEMVVVPIAGPGARLRGDAALSASVLIGAVNGLAHEWLLMRPRPDVSELTDLLIPVALSLIET